jgi:hypothetical protein
VQVAARIALALGSLLVPVSFGLGRRDPAVLAVLIGLATVHYALGRWSVWVHTWTTRGLPAVLGAVAVTAVIQGILTATLYGIGQVVAWLAGVEGPPGWTPMDTVALGLWGVASTTVGVGIVRSERASHAG